MGSWIPLPDLLSMFLKRLLEKLPDLLSRFYFFVKPCKTHYLLDTNYHPYLLMFWSLEMGSICISSCASYITQFTAISIWWKRFFLFLLCCLLFLLVFLAFQVFPVSLNNYNDFKSQYIVVFIRYKPTGQNYKLYIYASNLVHTNVTFWLPLYVQENSKLTDSWSKLPSSWKPRVTCDIIKK